MLGRATYLALMAGCLLVTLPRAGPQGGCLPPTPPLAGGRAAGVPGLQLWDWLAIRRNHWSYSSTYTSGIELLGIPLEELVFFVVVPTCVLLTYQAVVRLLPARAPR